MDLIDQSGGGSKESEANESREEINNNGGTKKTNVFEDFVTNDEKLDKNILLNNDVKE